MKIVNERPDVDIVVVTKGDSAFQEVVPETQMHVEKKT